MKKNPAQPEAKPADPAGSERFRAKLGRPSRDSNIRKLIIHSRTAGRAIDARVEAPAKA